jgi:carbon-monoxide dehydrogenase large subunit
MPSPVLPKLVGQRVKRREDPRLIQGRATYVDDIKVAGMQHLAFKRSDVAHGRIRSLDTSAALAMDGVEAVYTGAQIAELVPPMPVGTPWPAPEHRAVAVDTVRYSGEPVAVVVARDRYVARDAADAIVVSYDPLPVVVDPELAMSGQPTVIYRASRTTWCWPASGAKVSPVASSTRRPSLLPFLEPRSSSRSGW